MGRWKSEEERRELGKRAVHLRDVEKLKWTVIAERLAVNSVALLRVYYNKHKESEELALPRMDLEEAKALAAKLNIEVGWIWLYGNGYPDRVPQHVKSKIEDWKLEVEYADG